MWDPAADFVQTTLANGLEVHSAHWPDRPWQTFGFLIHAGAEQDAPGYEGTAHFLEHVVGENGPESRQTFEDAIEKVGGMADFGATSFMWSRYRCFIPVARPAVRHTLNGFGQMLMTADLQKGIETERTVILEEYRKYYPLPMEREMEMCAHGALFGDHVLGRTCDPLGSLESVSSITPAMLRQFFGTFYVPKNTSIVTVGGLSVQDVAAVLEDSPFASKKPGERVKRPVADLDCHVRGLVPIRLSASDYPGKLAPKDSPSYVSQARIPGMIGDSAMHVFAEMLDRVLMDELREKRLWTYGAHCHGHSHVRFHDFSIHCDSFSEDAVDTISETVDACVRSIPERAEMLESVINHRIAATTMIDISGKQMCDMTMHMLQTYGTIRTLPSMLEEIRNVTRSDLESIAGYLASDRRYTRLMTP